MAISRIARSESLKDDRGLRTKSTLVQNFRPLFSTLTYFQYPDMRFGQLKRGYHSGLTYPVCFVWLTYVIGYYAVINMHAHACSCFSVNPAGQFWGLPFPALLKRIIWYCLCIPPVTVIHRNGPTVDIRRWRQCMAPWWPTKFQSFSNTDQTSRNLSAVKEVLSIITLILNDLFANRQMVLSVKLTLSLWGCQYRINGFMTIKFCSRPHYLTRGSVCPMYRYF